MSNEVVFKLGEMLHKELETYHGQVLSFSNAIESANEAEHARNGSSGKADNLEYRKLARFLSRKYGDKFQFSISELRALDCYFTLQQQSLCKLPIFYRSTSALDYLAESNEITFAMATRYVAAARTETVSRWDLRAMKLLFNKGIFEHTRTEVVDVFHHAPNFDHEVIRKESWNDIFDKPRSSIVAFGSPFACHATEQALAKMFGTEPYLALDPAIDRNNRLPLYFFWPKLRDRQHVKTSRFLIGRRDICKLFEKDSAVVQNFGNCDRGIIVGDNWYASEHIGESYGLFIAQRQNEKHIYSTIIGAYGPNTYAVAECLAERRIIGTLPPYDQRDRPQPILMAIIKTHTAKRPRSSAKRETRVISSESKVIRTELWELDTNNGWQTRNRNQAQTK
jgi:hypothetical protein